MATNLHLYDIIYSRFWPDLFEKSRTFVREKATLNRKKRLLKISGREEEAGEKERRKEKEEEGKGWKGTRRDTRCLPILSPVVIENRFCFMISRRA